MWVFTCRSTFFYSLKTGEQNTDQGGGGVLHGPGVAFCFFANQVNKSMGVAKHKAKCRKKTQESREKLIFDQNNKISRNINLLHLYVLPKSTSNDSQKQNFKQDRAMKAK
jgi:hypothetical protein